MNIVHKSISVYAENARLKKRVRALRNLLDETITENLMLRGEIRQNHTALERLAEKGVILR